MKTNQNEKNNQRHFFPFTFSQTKIFFIFIWTLNFIYSTSTTAENSQSKVFKEMKAPLEQTVQLTPVFL